MTQGRQIESTGRDVSRLAGEGGRRLRDSLLMGYTHLPEVHVPVALVPDGQHCALELHNADGARHVAAVAVARMATAPRAVPAPATWSSSRRANVMGTKRC